MNLSSIYCLLPNPSTQSTVGFGLRHLLVALGGLFGGFWGGFWGGQAITNGTAQRVIEVTIEFGWPKLAQFHPILLWDPVAAKFSPQSSQDNERECVWDANWHPAVVYYHKGFTRTILDSVIILWILVQPVCQSQWVFNHAICRLASCLL